MQRHLVLDREPPHLAQLVQAERLAAELAVRHLEQDAARPRSDRREARHLFLDVRRRERPVLCADDQRREAEQLARGVLLVQEEVRCRLHDEGRPREPGHEVARAAADSSRVHAEGSQLRAHAGGEEEGRLLAELARDLGLKRLEPRAAAVHVDGVALAAHLCGGGGLRRVCEHLRGWPARKGGAEAERLRRERRCDSEGDRSHKLPGVQNTELRRARRRTLFRAPAANAGRSSSGVLGV
mmetsp:Transcript_50471/g.162957  ORF Transcript_50471/g.162957 Transcript_50471/m.162957 type:complete len:240 (-) Transcript_50471:33-752(-)